ncbi:Uncharacterised protein [Mycobacteroides abscessus subsp. abscessus]|nr:Uncharacterised protein [Mycobacteroides abscessus subsp. abscessus]
MPAGPANHEADRAENTLEPIVFRRRRRGEEADPEGTLGRPRPPVDLQRRPGFPDRQPAGSTGIDQQHRRATGRHHAHARRQGAGHSGRGLARGSREIPTGQHVRVFPSLGEGHHQHSARGRQNAPSCRRDERRQAEHRAADVRRPDLAAQEVRIVGRRHTAAEKPRAVLCTPSDGRPVQRTSGARR